MAQASRESSECVNALGDWSELPVAGLANWKRMAQLEIAQEVEAIEDLVGLRGAEARAFDEDLSAVMSDNGDVRMLSQPRRDALDGAVGQRFENSVPLQVDD
ncbi:hypothetical protein [Methylobacterium sp. 17Sr1-1]|uniref:hypothetical protein n=1 Tax=Methylobacterium sp. 17Sr1-1 TaxID=2202826 RepID=UPI001FDFB642|nr:hypothetical protein [Methylobacterium sp. 17Sr1-1]